ncbi:MAG: GNAT family N-acetyltransferase [Streptococcaceae bacterium]|jgi:N-acetylglutamate synthase-like GNAT family acetyltransferase|nr:GNAT family N-acetyltransferase [Streptococcaceae bacterium]
MEYLEITDIKEKSMITNKILRKLPEWFGVESSIIEYVNEVTQMTFYVAVDKQEAIGFIALKQHNEITSEINVMGILSEYHRQGIGAKLVEMCEQNLQKGQVLTVKTLAATHPDRHYAKTRKFYEKMNFVSLEVFTQIWGEENPCLFLAKFI